MQGVMIPDDLKAEMMPTSALVPYAGNAKRHPDWQVEQIANSIQAFGFNDPIAVWHDVAGHPVVVEGHGRLLAAKRLGMGEVPVIRLDHLDEEGRRAYTLAHNKLTMNTDYDALLLDSELDAIEGFDMGEFGFETIEPSAFEEDEPPKYTQRITTPVYEVTGECPGLSEMVNTERYERAMASVRAAEGVPDDVVEFLELAAARFIEFDYGKVAEYYAHAPANVQRVMEDELLVIVDFDKAIELGCVTASERLLALREEQVG